LEAILNNILRNNLSHIDNKCNYKTSVDCPQVDLVEVEEKQYREATKIVQY